MLRDTSPQRFESFDAVVLSPDKSVQWVAFNKGGVTVKPDDIAVLIDCRRRVPPIGSKVADVSHPAVFPKHGVPGCMSSNGLVADARNAHDLTIVIDRRGGSGSVAGDQREVVDLIWRSQSPHGWAKLEDLVAWRVGTAARGVMNAILRPPDHLTQVVGSGGKAIISASKIGQSPSSGPIAKQTRELKMPELGPGTAGTSLLSAWVQSWQQLSYFHCEPRLRRQRQIRPAPTRR